MAFPPSQPRPPRPTGFTLIEAIITVALLATLATLAWPSAQAFLDRQRLQSAASRLAAHLQLARTEAIARNETVHFTLLPDDALGSCYLVHTGAASSCSCAAGCGGAGQVLLHSVAVPAQGRIRLAGPAASLRFDPQLGTCTPTATFTVAAPGGASVHQIINVLGRVRSCSPRPAVPGHAAC